MYILSNCTHLILSLSAILSQWVLTLCVNKVVSRFVAALLFDLESRWHFFAFEKQLVLHNKYKRDIESRVLKLHINSEILEEPSTHKRTFSAPSTIRLNFIQQALFK